MSRCASDILNQKVRRYNVQSGLTKDVPRIFWGTIRECEYNGLEK